MTNSKNPTIKIAGKNSGTDAGPGDPLAAPSVEPELVELPRPPTASELVVKSSNSRVIKTINDPVSLPKNSHLSDRSSAASGAPPSTSNSGSAGLSASPDASTKPPSADGKSRDSGSALPIASQAGSAGRSTSAGGPPSTQAGAASGVASKSQPARFTSAPASADAASGGSSQGASPGASEHDEVEEGEGEVEQPTESPSLSPSGADMQKGMPSGGVDTAPASSGGGLSKMSPKTSGHRTKTIAPSSASSHSSSGPSVPGAKDKKKKKVTKFRYHKRITVRTHGKTSPSTIMDKVSKKDHSAALTPSTIGDMDPQELMQRAGIKGNKKAHWRVRLRQTKRLTKNGKTITQTKVAYRDSEGNKRVKTVPGTECTKCGKKVEDCKCDDT